MIGTSPFSEVRLNEALENACAKVLDYKVHKDKIKALRYEKSMLNFYIVNIICLFYLARKWCFGSIVFILYGRQGFMLWEGMARTSQCVPTDPFIS